VLKGIGNLASLLKQAQEMGGRMQGLSEELKGRRATGTAAGGMVHVEVNGLQQILSVKIDPELIEQGDGELIEDLVAAAANQALSAARELHMEAVKSLTGGMALPGLDDALAQLGGAAGPPTDGSS